MNKPAIPRISAYLHCTGYRTNLLVCRFSCQNRLYGSGVHSFQEGELHCAFTATGSRFTSFTIIFLSFRRGLPTHLSVSSPHLVHYQSHGRSDVFTARILSVHLLRIVTYGGFYLRIIEINQIRIPLGMSLLSQ